MKRLSHRLTTIGVLTSPTAPLHSDAMSKSQYIPFRVPPEIVELVEDAIAKTKLSKSEVMRWSSRRRALVAAR